MRKKLSLTNMLEHYVKPSLQAIEELLKGGLMVRIMVSD